jgi:hypothetical protein
MKLIALCLCIMLTACAGAQAQQPAAAPGPQTPQPAASTQPAAAEPTPAPESVTVTLPKWPGVFAYHSKDPEVIIIMSVKEPAKFTVPNKFTFKRKDGTSVEVPLLQPDKKSP